MDQMTSLSSVDEIARVPGLGPKRARRLVDELGIDSLEALRAAAEGHRIRSLKGFGPKAEESILDGLGALSAGNGAGAATGGEVASTSSAGEVAKVLEVFNASPVDVVVWSDGSVVGQVASLERVSQAWPERGLVEVRPVSVGAGGAPVRVLERSAVGTEAVIGPDDFRSVRLDGATVSAVFVNDTNVYLDVYAIEESGSAALAANAVAPGGRSQQESHPGAVWMVRAAFTDQLEGMFVLGVEPVQALTVTGAFSGRAAESAPLPSPLPPIEKVALVGFTRERPKPESRDYIVISEHDNLERRQFNARSKVATRTVRVAGAKLIWDKLDDRAGLMSYQGEQVLDLEGLEIYADHVVIASPLRFPGTNVTIHARRLEFKRDGRIDTTPIAPKTQARAQSYRDELPLNKNGQFEGASGMTGDCGGEIGLFVQVLTLPPGGEDQKRFVARGASGQQAEPGGQRPRPTAPDADKPQGGQDVASDAEKQQRGLDAVRIEESHVADRFSSAFVAAKSLSDWRWPGEVGSPAHVNYSHEGQPLKFGPDGNVVDLVVVAHDDAMGGTDTNVFWLPSGDRKHSMHVWGNAPIDAVRIDGQPIVRPPARRPGDGEAAYPGGQPGNGGDGGKVRTSLPLSSVEPLCDLAGGAAGPETPAAEGRKRGQPDPAFQVQMDVVKRTWPWESSRSPMLLVNRVSASDGATEPARRGRDGQAGQAVAENRGWLEPEVIDAVLACARDAHRNGHRDLARELLEPYYARLRSGAEIPEALAFRAVSIESMRENLRANLDYYGNPPGWLPRLRLSSNFELFQTLRQLSLRMLFYAMVTEQKYDTLAYRRELAQQTSDVLDAEMNACVGTLQGAVEELAGARVALEDARRQVEAKQDQIGVLKSLTENEALDAVERQRIFRGVCKTVGGLMKVVPVGQPYLGLAGDAAGIAGDIDFKDPKAIGQQVGDALGKLGNATDTFLTKNADLIKEDRVKELKSKLKLERTSTESLGDQLARTKQANLNVQKAIDLHSKPIESEWNKERDAELKWLKDELARVEGQVKTLSDPKTDSEQKQKEAAKEAEQRLKERIGETEAATLIQQRATLTRSIEWMTEAIAAEKAADTAATAARNQERVAQLASEKQHLEEAKQRIDGLEERQREGKQQEKQLDEEIKTQQLETGQTLNRLKGMGAGMTMLGQGIASLTTPATTADADVKAFAKTLLTSKKRDQYERVMREFQALAKVQTAAMDRLKSAQYQITTNLARVSDNLTAQNALSRQQQSLDGVLDIRTKRYLREMRERARDTLNWSMYHLMMSFRYEFLDDIGDKLYNYSTLVDELRKLEAASIKPGERPAAIQETEFKALDDRVLQAELMNQARKILEKRQHRAGAAMQNSVTLRLSEEQRKELLLTGKVTFNLVRDMGAGSFDWENARIVDVTLDGLDIVTQNPALSLRLTFRHSGESIILGREGDGKEWRYYYFRAAPGDDPIEWGFSYNTAIDTQRIKKDAREPDPDAMLKRLLDSSSSTGANITFKEYSPAYFSDLTLHLTPGAGGRAGGITDITKLQFTVSYALTTERRS
jgi:hypothetical protein